MMKDALLERPRPLTDEREAAHPDCGCALENGTAPNAAVTPAPVPTAHTPRGASHKRAFLHDVALTMGAEAGIVASGILLTSIVSRLMGARPLSEYLLLRRVLNWAVAGVLLGLATGLPRSVAHAAGRLEAAGQQDDDQPIYFLAALICMIPNAAAVAVLMVLYRVPFAQWLFGNRQETGLVIALAILLFGFAIHRAVGGYYRGLLEMGRAALLEFCNTALLPVVVVLALYRSQPIGAMMLIVGGLMTVIAAVFSVPILRLLCLRRFSGKLRARCKELLTYGLPHMPGEFGSAALLALGPILAAHYMKIADVSPLLLGLSMLLVIGYAANPLGTVLLSKVSKMLGKSQHREVQAQMRLLVAAIIELSVFTCLQLTLFADVVVRAWVGPGFEDEMGVIRLVLLAIPLYLFHVGLRSTIDAASVKPYNSANVLISLAFYLMLIAGSVVLFHGRTLLLGLAASLLSAELMLAMLTARTFRKFYGLGVPWRSLGPSIAASLVLGAAATGLRVLQPGPISLPEIILVEALLTSVYLALLAKRRSGWIVYAWQVGFLRREIWPADAAQP